jgi:hypothetical protein
MKLVLIYFLRTFDFILHLVRFPWSEFLFFAEICDGQQLHPLDSVNTVPLEPVECCGKFRGLFYFYSCGDPRICETVKEVTA